MAFAIPGPSTRQSCAGAAGPAVSVEVEPAVTVKVAVAEALAVEAAVVEVAVATSEITNVEVAGVRLQPGGDEGLA